MNLHWSFSWGYGEDFLSNCCFKKRCVDSTGAIVGLKMCYSRSVSISEHNKHTKLHSQ